MKKGLLNSEYGVSSGSVEDRLRAIVREMELGDYTESDAAVLITRDKATGVLTFTHMTEGGIDDVKKLFDEAAKTLGYGRIV